MLCMLPLRGVSVRRLDRCIPSFSPSRLCFPLFLLHFCHLCHTKVPIHRTFTSFTVCLPAGSTSASSFARTFSSLPQVCASESEYVCLQIERVYSHSLIPLCMVLWCVVGSVPLGRACSCLPWMSFLRLAPPMLFSGCPPLMVLRCSSLLCRWFCLLAWLPFVAFVAWVLAVLPALFWLPLSLPSPRGCPWVFSGPASVLLVPPSGFLVVSATVWLSYLWHGVSWPIGSCPHSASWQQRLRPCVGLCPLHHGVGVVHVPFAPALRYSPSGDPESP